MVTTLSPQLPSSWVYVELGKIVESITTGFPSGQHNKEGKGVPHIRPMNITAHGEISLEDVKYIQAENYEPLKEGDILFNNTNSPALLGKTAYIKADTNWAFSNHMTRLRVYHKYLVPKFFSHFLHHLFYTGYFKLNRTNHVNQASINTGFLNTIVNVPVPPLNEQRRIVAEIEKQFDRLDEGIAALKRVEKDLRLYRASVLRAACEGRLVPTEATLAQEKGRDYEPASALLQRILKQRRAKWEHDQLDKMSAQGKRPKDNRWKENYVVPEEPSTSHLPELPEGWMWVTWEQIGYSQNGRLFPSEMYQRTGIRLLRPGNLHTNGQVVWNEENTRYLSEEWAAEFKDYIIGERELVMNLTAQSLKDEFLGRTCLTGKGERCLLNQRIARLTPILVSPEYLLWIFKSKLFRRFVDGLNQGSLIQHMYTSQVAEFVLPMPPLAEQKRIAHEVERRLRGIEELEATVSLNLERAEELRRSILKRAFEGRLIPQDPKDESASVLLKHIAAERQRKAEKSMKEKKRKSPRKPIERELSLFNEEPKGIFRGLRRPGQADTIETVFEEGFFKYDPNDEGEYTDIDAFFEELAELLTQAKIELRRYPTEVSLYRVELPRKLSRRRVRTQQ